MTPTLFSADVNGMIMQISVLGYEKKLWCCCSTMPFMTTGQKNIDVGTWFKSCEVGLRRGVSHKGGAERCLPEAGAKVLAPFRCLLELRPLGVPGYGMLV